MADIVDVLLSDHREVRRLFEAFETAPSDEERLRLARQVVKRLSQHDAAEELVVWPAAREAGLKDVVEQRLDEERVVREELHQLDKKTPEQMDFDAQFDHVRSKVMEHVYEEEEHSFPRLREVLDPQAREALALRYLHARDEAPTRPHPLAPSTPPGLKVAAAASAPLDRMRDRMRESE